ncbi:uncharacterized protein LOC144160855 [Haemaphysalis longicornis]
MTQPLPCQVTLQQPRTPAIFHGEAFEDVEDWLEQFERVASFNQWDARQKLREVYYSLEHGARTWFENREARLSTWEEFRQELLESFASSDRRDHAQRLLESRIQKPNETVAMFAEDMARLFRRADPEMSEPKKLRHLMHGVKEQLFAGLVRNPPRTVKDFIKEATAIEHALRDRCRQYDRVTGGSPSATAAATASSDRSLRELVRSIVREELQLHGIGSSQPSHASVADIVRQEIREALAIPESQPQQLQPSYVSVVRRHPPVPPIPAPQRAPQTDSWHQGVHTNPHPRPRMETSAGRQVRKSDVWRTNDNRPLCFHCGEAGHIYRRCPYREIGLSGFAPTAPRPCFGQRPPAIEEYLAARRDLSPNRRPRSPSPANDVSPNRRNFGGILRGRSPSPRRGN